MSESWREVDESTRSSDGNSGLVTIRLTNFQVTLLPWASDMAVEPELSRLCKGRGFFFPLVKWTATVIMREIYNFMLANPDAAQDSWPSVQIWLISARHVPSVHSDSMIIGNILMTDCKKCHYFCIKKHTCLNLYLCSCASASGLNFRIPLHYWDSASYSGFGFNITIQLRNRNLHQDSTSGFSFSFRIRFQYSASASVFSFRIQDLVLRFMVQLPDSALWFSFSIQGSSSCFMYSVSIQFQDSALALGFSLRIQLQHSRFSFRIQDLGLSSGFSFSILDSASGISSSFSKHHVCWISVYQHMTDYYNSSYSALDKDILGLWLTLALSLKSKKQREQSCAVSDTQLRQVTLCQPSGCCRDSAAGAVCVCVFCALEPVLNVTMRYDRVYL